MVELALMSMARIQGTGSDSSASIAQPAAQPVRSAAPAPTVQPAPAPPVAKPAENPAPVAPKNPLSQMTRLSDLQNRKTSPAEPVAPIQTAEDNGQETAEPVVLTVELLQACWLEFAEQLRADQPRLFSTMTTQLPGLSDDKKIILNLNNLLQEKAIRSIQTELLQFLRKRTGNTDLDMQTVVSEDQAEKKLYTQEEKYLHLQKKNPDLDLFRQSLNLDLE
jgi:hypothetical protein